jgi:hypothetical protein
VGNRFLPCLFNELVDFVEIEQAWHHCVWSDEAKKTILTHGGVIGIAIGVVQKLGLLTLNGQKH